MEANKCKFCDYACGCISYLKKHIKAVYETSKDHKCEACGKAFSEAVKLTAHIRSVHDS